MSWVQLQVVVSRGQVDLISNRLFEQGALGLQEDHLPGEAPEVRQPWDTAPPAPPPERVLLRAWWPVEAGEEVRARVEADLAGHTLTWEAQTDEDWADSWRENCRPVRISDALVVAPPWAAGADDLVIEPGMAFGTGDHETTRACLGAVVEHAVAGERCLDVGTGSGVLALAAARLGMVAWGIDIDADAVQAARGNAERNGLTVRMDDTPLADVEGTFELVVANLFAEVIVGLADDLKRVCGRRLAVAGILTDRSETVVAALAPMHLEQEIREGDWVHMEFSA